MFDLTGKIAVITGGYGVLGASMAKCLAKQGAKIAILDLNEDKEEKIIKEIKALGSDACFFKVNVLDKESLIKAKDGIVELWGKVDILINCAGGNMPGATIAPDQTFFDMDIDAYKKVLDLNLVGTVTPTMVFGEQMAKQGKGSIINISSMAAQTIITRVVGYSSAKAAIDNFTRWTAVEFAKKFGEGVRVNAIAPGFFITQQNRTLMTNPDGSYSDRAKDVIRVTPFGRLGDPEELNGAIVYLASDESKFVTGAIIPIDGGFSIFSGV